MSMIPIKSELFPVYNHLWSAGVKSALKQLQWALLGMSFSIVFTSNIWMISWINVIYVDILLNNGVISSRIIFKTISCSPLVKKYLIHGVRQNVFYCVNYVRHEKWKAVQISSPSVLLDLSSMCCKVVFSTAMASSHACCLSVVKEDAHYFRLWSVVKDISKPAIWTKATFRLKTPEKST